jgi:predicted 2-oxoglutarate/Fe(II)-dependent dioxygenase YbiX
MLNNNVYEISQVTHLWCYQKDIFNLEELKKIKDYCNQLPLTESSILVKPENDKISPRISKNAWISYNEETAWFWETISNNIEYLNNKFYGYKLWGYDNLQYSEYDCLDNGKYDWHIDMGFNSHKNNITTRKLSATLLLNDDFNGGDFEMHNGSEQFATSVPLKSGTLIVFPSFAAHRVTPVTLGTRRSLVAWCVGPKFK